MTLSEAACKLAKQHPVDAIKFRDTLYMKEEDIRLFYVSINELTYFTANYNVIDYADKFGKLTVSFEVVCKQKELADYLAKHAMPEAALYSIFAFINSKSKRLFPDWTDGFAYEQQFDELIGTTNSCLAYYDTDANTLIIDFDGTRE